jgi:hypothetical protein
MRYDPVLGAESVARFAAFAGQTLGVEVRAV